MIGMKVNMNTALAKARKEVAAKLGSMDALAAAIVDDVAKFEAQQAQQVFKTDGAASGKPWPDILEGEGDLKGYKRWKARNWPGRKLNVWRGDTRDSFTQISSSNHIARSSGSVLQFGSNAPLASKMQEGEKRSGNKPIMLREKTPVPQKPRRTKFLYKTTVTMSGTGRRRTRKEYRYSETPRAPLKWFAFFLKEVPARPLARKSGAQLAQLKIRISKSILTMLGKAGAGTVMGREFAVKAASLRADPRVG